MVNILNRRAIFTGTDAEEAASIWSTLKENGIAYKMQSKGMGSRLASGMRVNMGMSITSGAARYSDYADSPNYIYTIYVRKSDLARARELLSC